MLATSTGDERRFASVFRIFHHQYLITISDERAVRLPSMGLCIENVHVLELGLINEKPIGQVLIQSGFIDNTLLTAALKLQEMVEYLIIPIT